MTTLKKIDGATWVFFAMLIVAIGMVATALVSLGFS